MKEGSGKVSLERLYHYDCGPCSRWFTIADHPQGITAELFCPWCGTKQTFTDTTPKRLV